MPILAADLRSAGRLMLRQLAQSIQQHSVASHALYLPHSHALALNQLTPQLWITRHTHHGFGGYERIPTPQKHAGITDELTHRTGFMGDHRDSVPHRF